MRRILLLAVLYLALSPFVLADENIMISNAWVREVPPGSNVSAAYMTIKNLGKQDDTLKAISSDSAENVEIHMSSVDENGVANMEMVKTLELPVDENVELNPGGMHLMLIGLKESLVGKEKILLTLSFENSGNIDIEVPVKSMKNDGGSHHHH